MEQALGQLIHEIRLDLATLPGLAPIRMDVPDSINDLPTIIVYPSAGTWRLGTHSNENGKPMRWALHTIRVELEIARKDLARDMEQWLYFADSLPDFLFAGFKRDRFNGTMVLPGDPRLANNATAPIRYQVLSSQWGDTQTLINRLEFDVSTEQEINP